MQCSSNKICTQPTESYVILGFYSLFSGGSEDTAAYRLTVSGTPPPDSNPLLYSNRANQKKIVLPLSNELDYSSFLLTFKVPDTIPVDDTFRIEYPEFTDEVTLFYQRNLRLVSPECGFSYEYQIDSVLFERTIIRNLEIINATVTPDEIEHIKIYL